MGNYFSREEEIEYNTDHLPVTDYRDPVTICSFHLSTLGHSQHSVVMDMVRNNHANCLETVITVGANVNDQDENGLTPLMLAASMRCDKILDMLLEAGVDVNVVSTADSRTALMKAAGSEMGTEEFRTQSWKRAAWTGYACSVRTLIEAGAKLDFVDDSGMTALDHAIECKAELCERKLRQAGAPVRKYSSYCDTQL